ncbi:post-GPI attachment to proteins factor 3 isoform X3 [Ceratina calcarata]|uniref:Post-GPI attachment to proteins factor 3 n=1 Tax=Ceratina calcarata TaxID=156304 RepID=A0AAJ7NB90_9HYME|nr:post-GPI attachment to proteins factor 3 isoform X3 [Ceratina calcarata]
MSRSKWLTVLAFQLFLATSINGSIGDRSQFYSLCLEKCSENNCNNDQMFKVQPSLSLRLLLWSCREDCSYTCTWKTVDYFTSHGLKVPQFHGKICMHGWFWSSVFHARDTPFTEVMDYTCAFIMVLTLLYCMLLRITYRNNKSFVVITCGYLSILYSHLSHLWSGYINYDYNMKFNVVIGFSTFVLTMIWWRRNRKRLSYIYLIGWFNVLTVLVTILEVADFAPIFWVFDAHSLWHASTVPLAILIYRFMMADCSYLNTVYSKLTLDIDHHIH